MGAFERLQDQASADVRWTWSACYLQFHGVSLQVSYWGVSGASSVSETVHPGLEHRRSIARPAAVFCLWAAAAQVSKPKRWNWQSRPADANLLVLRFVFAVYRFFF